ncbi:MAG: RNA polymerase sigma factor [Verrucomicrobia bacterium]|nr:RNA polymerase sigma factor [Verrucomicrobiota bacterium]
MPSSEDTSVAQNARLFATTHWSVVQQAGHGDSAQSMQALETLCRSYWYPLYAYVRRQGRSPHDAEDLTQEFFARLLARDYIQLADRNQGLFRTFLLTSLKHFLINDWKKGNREKRGGGQKVLSLDEELAETRFLAEPSSEQPPDTLYDRGWAAVLLDRAFKALRAEFEHAGKLDLFERLKVFVWGEKNALSYAEMAGQLGMTEGAVKVAVHRMRQRYGELLRAEVAQTVSTPTEVNDELRYLVSVLRDRLANSGNVPSEKL